MIKDAIERLALAPIVQLQHGEAAAMANSTGALDVHAPVYLVRALTTSPPHGAMTVTLCGDTLFVSYVGDPTAGQVRTQRSAILVNLHHRPDHVVINAAAGRGTAPRSDASETVSRTRG